MRFLRDIPNKKTVVFLLVLSALAFYAGCMFQKKSTHVQMHASIEKQPLPISLGERIMTALAEAYPDRIGPAQIRDGDWAFFLGGRWFYYAEGRILPEEHRSRAIEYSPIRFNMNYLAELPAWEDVVAGRIVRTNRQPQLAGRSNIRSQYFFEALWNISNSNQASAQQIQIDFLGHSLTIHSGLSQIVSLIEEIILNESRTNPEVRQWVNSLGTVHGWNWRNIGSSGNRSFHSYGIAIDILPRDLGGLATYWAWTSTHNPQWRNIPFSERYHPPDMVVRTFESFGFIWGGKWIHFYDTMHFEYRPEVFILSDIPMANFRSSVP